MIDLTGKKINRKTILKFEGYRDNSRAIWKFRCDCGYIGVSNTSNLKTGKCRSCEAQGSISKKRLRPYEGLLNSLKYRCKRKRVALTLTYDDIVSLTATRNCHYCGAAINWVPHHVKHESRPINLDRKNNADGYTLENVVVCCSRCNKAKNTIFTYEEWLQLGAVIRTWG
jgi:5-methylcytosine-specific restriction endonuclease McrA